MTDQAAPPADRTDTRLRRAVTGPLLFLFILGDVLGAGVYALAGQVAAEVGGAIWVPLLVALLLALLTAASYAGLFTLLMWQAERGQPLVEPDPATQTALLAWFAFTLGGLALLREAPQPATVAASAAG